MSKLSAAFHTAVACVFGITVTVAYWSSLNMIV